MRRREILVAKKHLALHIKRLCKEFESTTGVEVTNVGVVHTDNVGHLGITVTAEDSQYVYKGGHPNFYER